MPWRAKRMKYECRGCGYVVGGLDVPLERINPSGKCPNCGTLLQQVRCDHLVVKKVAGNMSCRVCHSIVVWEK